MSTAKAETSGKCGSNLTWTLDNDGLLTISGQGEMASANGTSLFPKESVNSVIIRPGVTSVGDYAFYNCLQLTSVMLPDTLTSIEEHAFEGCNSLIQIEIPQSVTQIGTAAFYRCTSLKSANIPEGLTEVPRAMFSYCPSLESIVIPSGIQGIGINAFNNCSGLTEVIIPNRVTWIGEQAFYNCSGLTEIIIPDSVTRIDKRAFFECSGLNNIQISRNLSAIEEYVFYKCNSLINITIPDTVTRIEGYAFAECAGMTGIFFPDSITSVSPYAFNNCDALLICRADCQTAIVLSQLKDLMKVTSPSALDFQWKRTTQGDGTPVLYLTGYSGTNTDVEIPSSIDGLPVIAIANNAFRNNRSITSVNIPDSVNWIGGYAFYGCSDLKSVQVGCNVEALWEYAFSYCSSLETINFPENLVTLADYVFSGCPQLKTIHVPDRVANLYSKAFYNCTGVEEVQLPSGITEMAAYMFNGCSSLKRIIFPENITTIPSSAVPSGVQLICRADCQTAVVLSQLKDLMKVTSPNNQDFQWKRTTHGEEAQPVLYLTGYSGTNTDVEIPSSIDGLPVIAIANDAFRNKTAITSVIIPDCVKWIGGYAFYGCSGLKSVQVGCNVEALWEYAFSYCSSLETINIPDGVTVLGDNLFNGCKALQTITVPEGVTSIPAAVFKDCSGLKSIYLHDNITSISQSALVSSGAYYCSLGSSTAIQLGICNYHFRDSHYPDIKFIYKDGDVNSLWIRGANKDAETVTIPEGVIGLGDHAFASFTRLKSIVLPASVTNIEWQAFDNCTSLESIICLSSQIIRAIANGSTDETIIISQNLPSLSSVRLPRGNTGKFDNCRWGNCGDNITYKIDSNNICTMTGSGDMWDFEKNTTPFTLIRSVSISNGITSIGDSTFRNSVSLSSLEIPDSVTRIGYYAIAGTYLKTMNIPSSVEMIGEGCFKSSFSLSSITLSEGLKSIGNDAFLQSRELKYVYIPKTVTYIGSRAFANCEKTPTVEGDLDGILFIGEGAFDGCVTDLYASIGSDGARTLSRMGKTFRDRRYPYLELQYSFQDDQEMGLTVISADKTLSAAEIPEGVTEIGESAFSGCGSLRIISFPETLTVIADRAFENCISLSDSVFPQSLTIINRYAFSGCSKLSEIILGESLNSIGEYAFSNCAALNQITVRNPDISIGSYAFGSCGNLTKAVMPGNLTRSVEDSVFSSCSGFTCLELTGDVTCPISAQYPSIYQNLKKIILSNGVTAAMDSAFSGCSALEEFSAAGSCAAFGANAFTGCSKLKTVVLSEGTESIGEQAFYNCSSIISIDLPDSITTVGRLAFAGCSGITEIVIPAGLTEISEGMFRNCTGLSSLMVPGNILVIGKNAFYGCENLESVQFHPSLMEVRANAFAFCSSLKSITIPGGFNGMSASAFTDCTKLKTVFFTDDVTIKFDTVYPDLFLQLETLYLSNDVKTIGASAFAGCASLKTVLVSENLTDIRQEAFSGCTKLETFVFPNGLETIGVSAFENCRNLKAVNLPAGLTDIGANAFKNCSSIKEATISGKPVNADSTAFEACVQLSKITLQGNMTTELKTLLPAVYQQISELIIVHGVEVIGASGFEDCAGLIAISLPDSIIRIDEGAFRNCADAVKLSVPGSLDDVDPSAFSGCGNLKRLEISGDLIVQLRTVYPGIYRQLGQVTLLDDVNNIIKSAFYGCINLTDVRVDGGNTKYQVVNGVLFDSGNTVLMFCPNRFSGMYEVPDGVKTISNYAFSNCPELEFISVPESVEVIEDNAFLACDAVLIANCCSKTDVWSQEHEHQIIRTHDWEEPTYTWSGDHSSVTALRVCSRDETHQETETAAAVSEVTKQPACEEKGQTTYTSYAFENTAFTVQTETLTNIDAIGHSWGDADYVWADNNTTVTATRICSNDISHTETEEATVTKAVTKPATCYNMGDTTYTAAFSNNAFSTQTKTLTDVPPTGHSWMNPGYTWAANNSQVVATRVCANDSGHIESETADVTSQVTTPATCTVMGKTTYTATFGNPVFATQTKVLQDVPALGHRTVTDAAVSPTCTETGLTEGSHCSVCGTVFVSQQVVSATGHSLVKVNKVEATCTETGTEAYWRCSVCGMLFSDQYARNPITRPATIPAQGHGWGAPSYTWAPDNRSVTAKRICTKDGTHQETETATVYSTINPPSVSKPGEAVYVARFNHSAFGPQQKRIAIPALNSMNVLTLPAGLTVIAEEAFEGNSSQAVIIPEGCRSIGRNAFANCPNLMYVRIPESVENVDWNAFEGCENVVLDYEGSGGAEKIPVLSVLMNGTEYDYRETVSVTASVAWLDGTADGLAKMYPGAWIRAEMITAGGEPVEGFAAQTASGLRAEFRFSLARDELKAGSYRILVETNVENWRLETDEFLYTAKRPTPDECDMRLQVSASRIGLAEPLTMTALVTDKHGNPAKDIAVGFRTLTPGGETAGFHPGAEYLTGVTDGNGWCSAEITAEPGTELTGGNYRAQAFVIGGHASDELTFEFVRASLLNSEIAVDRINFPDPVFLGYVRREFDTSGNGSLSVAETGAVKEIDVSEMNIGTIQGIEFFPNLETLNCGYNNLSAVDLSRNESLKYLYVENCGLFALDLSHNTKLVELNCFSNPISSLDLSRNTALKYLCVDACDLTSLDLSRNTGLLELYAASNYLTRLDVSACASLQYLYCQYNGITSLSITSNPKLRELCCQGNEFTTLNVSKSTVLTKLVKNAERITDWDYGYDDWGGMGEDGGFLRTDSGVTVTAGTFKSKPNKAPELPTLVVADGHIWIHELYGLTVSEANLLLEDKLVWGDEEYYLNEYFGVQVNDRGRINWIAIFSGTKYSLFNATIGNGNLAAIYIGGCDKDHYGWKPYNNLAKPPYMTCDRYPNRVVMLTWTNGKVSGIAYGDWEE